MSVQNGERLATKQDLADMYQGILPYLGGMPEMLANKFSKGDLYSTEERMIGQWIDSKPLYQKVVITTSPSSNSDESIYDYGAGNELKDYHGFLVKSNSMFDLNTHFLSTFDIVSYVYTDGHSIQMQCSRATEQGQTVVIILKYTKTTDSAISIGSDTDYSTEEKIVGTWIDGSPIYQRTITGTTPSSNNDTMIDLAALNIGIIVKCEGISNEVACVPLARYSASAQERAVSCFYNNSNKKLYIRNTGMSTEGNKTFYVTIQYTKTTT